MTVNEDVSKQTGQTISSLTGPGSGRRPVLSRRSEPKCRWSTRQKTRFKKYKRSQWKFRFRRKKNGGNSEDDIRFGYSDIRLPEFKRLMRRIQPDWPRYRVRFGKSGVML